jgi:ATP-dependent DNA helicase RecQ
VLLYSWADVVGYERFLDEIADAEVRDETRRKTVELFRLVERGGCRHQALVGYFDETIEPCGGSCDTCRGVALDDLVGPAAPIRRVTGGASAAEEIADPELFESLRVLRKRLADAEGVPAYIVFSDAVLRQMARCVPKTREEMALLSGVGPVKLARYGEAFLALLREKR